MSDIRDGGSLVIDVELVADLRSLLDQAEQLHLDLCDIHRAPLRDRLVMRGRPHECSCDVSGVLRRLTAWFAVHGDLISPLPADVWLRLSAPDAQHLAQARDQLAALDGVAVMQRQYADRRDRHGHLWHGALLRTGARQRD